MAGDSERSTLEDELQRLVEEETLPALDDARRAELQLLAQETHDGAAGVRARVVNGLVARVVAREMGAGEDRLNALAIAVAEVVVVLREWEWLDLLDMPPQGTG